MALLSPETNGVTCGSAEKELDNIGISHFWCIDQEEHQLIRGIGERLLSAQFVICGIPIGSVGCDRLGARDFALTKILGQEQPKARPQINIERLCSQLKEDVSGIELAVQRLNSYYTDLTRGLVHHFVARSCGKDSEELRATEHLWALIDGEGDCDVQSDFPSVYLLLCQMKQDKRSIKGFSTVKVK